MGSQHEDVVHVFLDKLLRNNVSEAAIHTVMGKLGVIRRWLEMNESDDRCATP